MLWVWGLVVFVIGMKMVAGRPRRRFEEALGPWFMLAGPVMVGFSIWGHVS